MAPSPNPPGPSNLTVSARGELHKIQTAVQQAKMELAAYETSMQEIRAADEKRSQELEAREKALTAKIRAFNEERINFADQKKRFQQTKQLQ